MPESSEELAAMLSERGSVCPICGQTSWLVASEDATLASTSEPEGLTLMRALCGACGFVAWFEKDLPEALQRLRT